MMSAVERKALRWLFGPDTGLSSQAMCCFFLTDEAPSRWSCGPADPADFGRCYRLLRAVPEWRKRVPELKKLGGEWARLVPKWDRLEALYEKEAPTGECPKLYALMMKLRFPRRRTTHDPAKERP